jgi:RNA polymerase sigma-70 factor (ECF subfamily)
MTKNEYLESDFPVDGDEITGDGFSASQCEIEALKRYPPETTTRIHKRYFPDVYRFACRRLNDPSLAEDVAAEAFTRLLECSLKGRGPKTNVGGWLMRTTANLVNDHYRAVYRHRNVELYDDIPADEPSPGEVFDNKEENRRLRTALRGLTDEQADVLALRFGRGLSVAATAETLGKNPNAVKALQFRAIGGLRKTLTEA